MKLKDSLPEELREEPALQNFEDIGSLAKGFLEAKKFQGQSIRIPGEDAGDDDWSSFNSKLLEKVPGVMPKPNFDDENASQTFFRSIGMPESVDGYELPKIDGLPEGYKVDDAVVSYIKGMAHESKLTNKQFNSVVSKIIKRDAEKFVITGESSAQNATALKDSWGEAYDQNYKSVKGLLVQLDAPESLVKAVNDKTIDSETMNWLLNVHRSVGKETKNPDEEQSSGFNAIMSPLEAKQAIDEINNNKEHPYWSARGDEKKRATERMVQLHRWANPS